MDGQSEQTNQWLEQYLWFWVNEQQDNWHSYLPLAKFVHNNWPNEMMGESPFFVLYGFNLHADWIDKPSPIPQVVLRIEQFKEARQHTQALMIKAQQSWVKHKDTPKYKEGDLIWLEGRHLQTNQPVIKLVAKRHHQQEHRLLPDFLLVPSRKAVQVAQVHKSNVGLLFNINFNNINLFD